MYLSNRLEVVFCCIFSEIFPDFCRYIQPFLSVLRDLVHHCKCRISLKCVIPSNEKNKLGKKSEKTTEAYLTVMIHKNYLIKMPEKIVLKKNGWGMIHPTRYIFSIIIAIIFFALYTALVISCTQAPNCIYIKSSTITKN